MADLRALLEELGYSDVRTLLNSGNVVFTGSGRTLDAAASRIERALVGRLGVSSRVTVLTAEELAAVVADNPLLDVAKDPTRLFVSFLTNPSDRTRLAPLIGQDWGSDVLALGQRVAYLWCPDGLLESRLTESVGRLLGDAVTIRNWATVTKIHAVAKGL